MNDVETTSSLFSTADFAIATQYTLELAGVFAVLTILAFVFKWGFRYRLVGVTSFTLVLTGGLFALSIVPFTPTIVSGATSYKLVFDNGGSRMTIAVAPDTTPAAVEATLQQVVLNKTTYGRAGRELEIRARTIVHPNDKTSEALYLGRAVRALSSTEDNTINIQLDDAAFAKRDRILASR
ncbi:MAG: DUF2518 family protein [Coleofasciculaceae cyanobacterium RL_1_1]|nr:DUF2518 family protein [Coleofasciculaceae cyanobacterium RL_1_1]